MIAVIDVTGNNLSSLTNAIKQLGFDYKLTHAPEDLDNASHVILPGVGAAPAAMKALKENLLIDSLRQFKKPLLGICLGMQILFDSSEEGEVDGLSIIPGCIKRLPALAGHPVPHMGWSKLHWNKDSSLLEGLDHQDYVYFVHSYALLESDYALASCQYSANFAAIVQHKNIIGMQFHPEKSASAGLKVLNNFLMMEAKC